MACSLLIFEWGYRKFPAAHPNEFGFCVRTNSIVYSNHPIEEFSEQTDINKTAMNIKAATSQNARQGRQAFTLVEVLISVVILAFMMVSLFAAFTFGFASIATTREDLRATQMMMSKLEAVRLCRWDQLTNAPTTFKDTYDPTISTNGSSGAIYGGTLITKGAASVATNIPAGVTYKDKVRLITVRVTWTNYTGTTNIVHSREIQTLSAYNGIQNYIYGYTVR